MLLGRTLFYMEDPRKDIFTLKSPLHAVAYSFWMIKANAHNRPIHRRLLWRLHILAADNSQAWAPLHNTAGL